MSNLREVYEGTVFAHLEELIELYPPDKVYREYPKDTQADEVPCYWLLSYGKMSVSVSCHDNGAYTDYYRDGMSLSLEEAHPFTRTCEVGVYDKAIRQAFESYKGMQGWVLPDVSNPYQYLWTWASLEDLTEILETIYNYTN